MRLCFRRPTLLPQPDPCAPTSAPLLLPPDASWSPPHFHSFQLHLPRRVSKPKSEVWVPVGHSSKASACDTRPPAPGACPGPAHLILRLRHARPALCATPTLRKGLCSPSPARAPHLVRATPLARSLKAPRSRVLRDTYSSGDFVINCLTFPEYEDYVYSWFVILSERRAEPRRKRSD